MGIGKSPRAAALLFFALLAAASFGQGRRVALVIGNAAYEGDDKLSNPVNDARDISKALTQAGFEVSLATDVDLSGMVNAVDEFTSRTTKGAQTALFFFAGHGIQVKGENYLIPVNLKFEGLSESLIEKSAQSVQEILQRMEEARTPMNILVIDACRTNPWGSRGGTRSVGGTRGFAAVENVPRGSFILFASEPGKPALDNANQKNGAFTGIFLKHLLTPGMEFNEMVRQVSKDLASTTNGKQMPYPSGLMLDDFFFVPEGKTQAPTVSSAQSQGVQSVFSQTSQPSLVPALLGSLTVTAVKGGTLSIDGADKGKIKSGGIKIFQEIEVGETEIKLAYEDGTFDAKKVQVKGGKLTEIAFAAPPERLKVPENMVWVKGGSFVMGSPASEKDRNANEVQHTVNLTGFYMNKYEVTVGEFKEFSQASSYKSQAEKDGGGSTMEDGKWIFKTGASWKNPVFQQSDKDPAIFISWNDAVEYCNWKSKKEGLTPCYAISDKGVTWERSANGYRLPTEAEWEYACRAGTTTATAYGSSIVSTSANFLGNQPYNTTTTGPNAGKTKPVGSYQPNAWGLYDLEGNAWEWCWDWFGDYPTETKLDPIGPTTGSSRILRGGSWLDYGQFLRSAFRHYTSQSLCCDTVGFRVVRQ